MTDNVNHPKHYEDSTSLECIEAMEVAFGTEHTAWWSCQTAFKYLWRHKNKNGEEDVHKAKWYIDWVESRANDGFSFSRELMEKHRALKHIYNKALLSYQQSDTENNK